jgi:hypothetical protein
MILDRYELYKTLNHYNSVNIKPKEMILPSLESFRHDKSNQKEFIEIQSPDIEIIDLELY